MLGTEFLKYGYIN